jgi:hypothetical protein
MIYKQRDRVLVDLQDYLNKQDGTEPVSDADYPTEMQRFFEEQGYLEDVIGDILHGDQTKEHYDLLRALLHTAIGLDSAVSYIALGRKMAALTKEYFNDN